VSQSQSRVGSKSKCGCLLLCASESGHHVPRLERDTHQQDAVRDLQVLGRRAAAARRAARSGRPRRRRRRRRRLRRQVDVPARASLPGRTRQGRVGRRRRGRGQEQQPAGQTQEPGTAEGRQETAQGEQRLPPAGE